MVRLCSNFCIRTSLIIPWFKGKLKIMFWKDENYMLSTPNAEINTLIMEHTNTLEKWWNP